MQKPAILLLKLVMWFFQILPERAAFGLGRFIGVFWFHVTRFRRGLVMDNLTQAFKDEKTPREIRRIARDNFVHYGLMFAEWNRIPILPDEYFRKRIVFSGKERMDEALKRGKGVIALCGHYGCWDMMAIGQAMAGVNAHIISKHAKSRAVDVVWQEVRESKGVRFLPAEDAALQLWKLLRTNRVLGIIFDQSRPGPMGIRVHFFGRPAKTMKLVAMLALRTGCAVVPINNWRDERMIHHVECGAELPLIRKDTEDDSILANTQLYNDTLESFIRQHPEQWLWIHRRWK